MPVAHHLIGWILVLGALLPAAEDRPDPLPAPPPVLRIEVEHPILLVGGSAPATASTRLSVTTTGFPTGVLTYTWTQVQDGFSPRAAPLDAAHRIALDDAHRAQITATFPAPGVYELRLTVGHPNLPEPVGRNVWVEVWDGTSRLMRDGIPDPLGAAPGLRPPAHVRTLEPDPGPFQHPRLYATDATWSEVHERVTHGVIAGRGFQVLREGLHHGEWGLQTPGTARFRLAQDLDAWMRGGATGPLPDLTCGTAPEVKDGKPDWGKAVGNLRGFHEQLRDACLEAWLAADPHRPWSTLPEDLRAQRRFLARVVAGVCRAQLTGSWDVATGTFHRDFPLFIPGLDRLGDAFNEHQAIALAYDFSARWMTEPERRWVRDFLVAVSAARTTGGRDFIPEADGTQLNRGIQRGPQANGDFINILEERVLACLVVNGEESGMDPRVVRFFTDLPRPPDYATSRKAFLYDGAARVEEDRGRDLPASRPYPVAITWPHARKMEVDNLQRAVWWNDDWYVSPWGFLTNRQAYYGFSAAGLWPAALAWARMGAFHQFVAAQFYHTAIHQLYFTYPGEGEERSPRLATNRYLWDWHDGGMDSRQIHALLLKYMYPEDPLVDYVWQPYAQAVDARPAAPFLTTLFGLDPDLGGRPTTLPQAAAAAAAPLTKLDPQTGVVAVRSGWQDEDLALAFDAGWQWTGHMHAAKNAFSLQALGRSWSVPPGYHATPANLYAGVLIQDPACAADPATEGFMGQSGSVVPAGSSWPSAHPTPPGRLVEVGTSADGLATWMVGDAKTAYDFCYGDAKAQPAIPQPWTRAQHMYPGLIDLLCARLPDRLNREAFLSDRMNVGWPATVHPGYNPVQAALRTILVVRGRHPYVLVSDDLIKDGTPRNYRWSMNCSGTFGWASNNFLDAEGKAAYSSLLLQDGATSREGILLHLRDQGSQPGLPRLLVRDLNPADLRDQPPIVRNDRPLQDYRTNRIVIDRRQVVEPSYRILLYPFRTGEALPQTTWDASRTILTIRLDDGTVDRLLLTRTPPDPQTRVHWTRHVPAP